MLTLHCSSYCQYKVSESVMHVKHVCALKWNSPQGISYKQVPGANLSATSFEILSNNRIAFLCNSSNEIVIVNAIDGRIIKRFPVSFTPRDFSYDKNMFYVLSEYKIVVYDENGMTINSFDFNRKFVGVERIARFNNSTYLILPSGNSLIVESNNRAVEPKEINGCITASRSQVATKLIGNNNYSVTMTSLSDSKFETMFQTDKKIAGVFVVGTTRNRIIIDVQTYITENPIRVERKIVSIEIDTFKIGKIIAEIKVPDVYYVLSNKDITLSSNGVLYEMITAPEGVFVYSISESKAGNNYPNFLTNKTYHFNDHLLIIEEN